MPESATSPPEFGRRDRLLTYPTSDLWDLRVKLVGLVDDLDKDGHFDVARNAEHHVEDIDLELDRRRVADPQTRARRAVAA